MKERPIECRFEGARVRDHHERNVVTERGNLELRIDAVAEWSREDDFIVLQSGVRN
jgi:hypothetical protein